MPLDDTIDPTRKAAVAFLLGRARTIRYPSATGKAGANVVLFATQEDFVGVGEEDPHFTFGRGKPWLKLTAVSHV
ncbi:hypothetical protein NRB_00570 [Novosphingobium sp. 11B]